MGVQRPAAWGQRLLCCWGSVGLSEAEEWLGREASVPSEDPDGDLYRKQAAAKKRKPRTYGTDSRGLLDLAAAPSQGP